LRDDEAEQAGVAEQLEEVLRVHARLVDLPRPRRDHLLRQLADGGLQLRELGRELEVHYRVSLLGTRHASGAGVEPLQTLVSAAACGRAQLRLVGWRADATRSDQTWLGGEAAATADQAAALTLRQSAPHAQVLATGDRVLEARLAHRALCADLLRGRGRLFV